MIFYYPQHVCISTIIHIIVFKVLLIIHFQGRCILIAAMVKQGEPSFGRIITINNFTPSNVNYSSHCSKVKIPRALAPINAIMPLYLHIMIWATSF